MPRFVRYTDHPGRFDDDASPPFDCDVRDFSIPFELIVFAELPLTFIPFILDVRTTVLCVKTIQHSENNTKIIKENFEKNYHFVITNI